MGVLDTAVKIISSSSGAGATIGATTDTATTGNSPGTLAAHLRGIVTALTNRLPASVGQKAAAGSLPVVLASDQSQLPASLGQKVKAGSFPVTLASDQDALAISSGSGAGATIGATTDGAALDGSSAASLAARLRGLMTILADVWDNSGDALRVTVATANQGYRSTVGSLAVTETANTQWRSTQATVTTAAGVIVSVPLSNRRAVAIHNLGTAPIYLGSTSGVTTVTGWRVAPDEKQTLPFGPALVVYAVAESGSVPVRMLEVA